jgi:hypothetical protein
VTRQSAELQQLDVGEPGCRFVSDRPWQSAWARAAFAGTGLARAIDAQ